MRVRPSMCESKVGYRKSSNKDRDSIRGRASDSSRGRGRYGQIKAGPEYKPGVKKGTGSIFYCSLPESVHQHKADITIYLNAFHKYMFSSFWLISWLFSLK